VHSTTFPSYIASFEQRSLPLTPKSGGLDIGICQVADTPRIRQAYLTESISAVRDFAWVFVCIPDKIHCLQSTSLLRNDRSRWFAISSLSAIFCSSNFSFMGGIEKKKKTGKVRNTFARSHTKHRWSWLLLGRPMSSQLERPMSLISSFTLFYSPPHLPPPFTRVFLVFFGDRK
jgi:hypothetical protein